MKLKSFNKINTSTKTTYLVYDKMGKGVDYFQVDYREENLASSIVKKDFYSQATVLWCDISKETGALMVGIEIA